MKTVSINKVLLQAKHLNSLLEDRSTPSGKILVETIMLNDLLEKYRSTRSGKTDKRLEDIYPVLKKTQKFLDEYIKETATNE